MARRDFKAVTVNCEPDLLGALIDFAAGQKIPVSVAARMLLRQALMDSGAEELAQDLQEEGYLNGVAEGLQAVREHMAKFKSR